MVACYNFFIFPVIKFPPVPLKNFRGFLLILKDANTPEVCFLRQVALAILILLSLFLFYIATVITSLISIRFQLIWLERGELTQIF